MAVDRDREGSRIEKEILKRLPVKSLLRFRCASKTWYSLISDPEFCNKLHQKRSYVLICERSPNYSTLAVESLMHGKTSTWSAPTISFPWQPKDVYNTEYLGSCKGLVCVDVILQNLRGLILRNPSTRKTRNLPPASRDRSFLHKNTCGGFGYDESADDYRFVWMKFKYPDSRPSIIEFDVFSLKSNTWSSFDYCTDIILSSMSEFCQTGVFTSGAIHWATRYEVRGSIGIRILAFDLASHKFTLLEPSGVDYSPRHNYDVVSLSGRLCLTVYHNKRTKDSRIDLYANEDSRIDLWMMKEYGVDSWLKLVSIPKRFTLLPTIGVHKLYPILFSNEEGEVVVMIDHLSLETRYEREIMRLQVEEGGAVVKAETLLSDYDYADYVFLHMEEVIIFV